MAFTNSTQKTPDKPHKPGKGDKIESELRHSGAIGRMSVITILSRCLGLVREQTRAFFLGTGVASEAFTAAFMIPNLLRRFLSEGIMSAAVVPVLTETMKEKDHTEVRALVSVVLGTLTSLLLVIITIGILLTTWYVPLFFPTFDIPLTTLLTAIMFPYIGFVSLAALFQSVLNCHGRFSLPAFCPVMLNVIIIGGIWLWWFACPSGKTQDIAAEALCFAVLAGGLVQAAMLMPALLRLKYNLRPRLSMAHPGLRRILRLVVPVALGGGIHQINVMISLILAARFKGAAPALNFSNRLLEVALGVFVMSVITVSLPGLSRLWHKNQARYFKQAAFALKLILLVSIPSGVGLLILRTEIITVLLNYGAFKQDSVALTERALLFHALAVPFIGSCRFFAQAFYAARNSKTPLKVGIVIALANISFCCLLIYPMGYGGIALAMSLSMGTGLLLYILAWHQKNGPGSLSGAGVFACKIILAGILMAVFHRLWSAWLCPFPAANRLAQALHLAGAVMVDSLFYFLTSRLLVGKKEMNDFIGVLIRRQKKRGIND